jgi:hypothetical protein
VHDPQLRLTVGPADEPLLVPLYVVGFVLQSVQGGQVFAVVVAHGGQVKNVVFWVYLFEYRYATQKLVVFCTQKATPIPLKPLVLILVSESF